MDNFEQLLTAIKKISNDIAKPNADSVDKEARYPIETMDALKKAKILSAGVPTALGGAGLDCIEQGKLCTALARNCSNAGMILGMHFIQVSTIVHFGKGIEQFEDYLKLLSKEQRLVGSVTSEEGVGGNLRSSITAIYRDGDRFELTKRSSCLSYGAYADDLLITSRKTPDSPASDQAVVLAIGDDFSLEQTGVWDSMGLRGTCSPPFVVTVKGSTWQIFENDFSEIAARTIVPETHFIWSNVWLGIATEAAARARTIVQAKARKNPSQLPDNARDLADLEIQLERFRDTVNSNGIRYKKAHENDDVEYLTSMGYSLKINALKLNASQMVADICMRAMAICGFPGYLNNTPFSISRLFRDSLSAAPMIGNGRIYETNATNLMAYKGHD